MPSVIPNSDGAVIHDFVHGVDQIELSGYPDASLTHVNDVYTIHFLDLDDQSSSTTQFTVVGVTDIDTSDYTFV